MLAFVREGTSEKLLCVFNFAEQERRWPWPGGVLVFDEIGCPNGTPGSMARRSELPPQGSYVGRVL